MSIFAERLVALRKQRGLSQEGLGDAVNMEQSEVSRYERGKREPSKEALLAFADFFGVTLDYLIGRSEEQPELPPLGRDLAADGVEVYSSGPEIKLPVYEEAAAGSPTFVNEHLVGKEEVLAAWVSGDDVRNYMLVIVKGDSMRDVGIMPDTTHLKPPAFRVQSRVLVHRQPVVKDNEVALVRFVNSGDVTIKRLHFINSSQVQLIPANPAYGIEEYSRDEIAVVGLVVRAVIQFD